MADVVLGNPVGDVLMGFMDQEVLAIFQITKRGLSPVVGEVSSFLKQK